MGKNEQITNSIHVLSKDGQLGDIYGQPFTRQYAGIERLPPGPATLIELLVHAVLDFRVTKQVQGGVMVEQLDANEKRTRVNIARRLRTVAITGAPCELTRMELAFIDMRCDAAYTAELYTVLHEVLTSLPVKPTEAAPAPELEDEPAAAE